MSKLKVESMENAKQVFGSIRIVIVISCHQGTWKLPHPHLLVPVSPSFPFSFPAFLSSRKKHTLVSKNNCSKIYHAPGSFTTSSLQLTFPADEDHIHLRRLGAAGASALARLAGALLVSAAAVALGLLLAVDFDELHLGLLGGLGAGLDIGVLGAAGAVALAGSTLAYGALGVAVAGSAVGTLNLVQVQVTTLLAGLEASKVDGLVVHVKDLLGTLVVERTHALASGSLGSLLEVRRQTPPALVGLLGDAVLLVDGLSLLGRVVLAIELLKGLGEAVGDTVLLVERNGLLDGLVREDVAMGEVFCEDAASGLVLLCDVFGRVTFGVTSSLAGSDVLEVGSGSDVDLVGSELSVVEEESGLSGSLFFEAHSVRLGGRILGVGSDGEVGNLSTRKDVSPMVYRGSFDHVSTHQKLKKSLTSFSVVSWLMPLTLTVLDMIAVCLDVMDLGLVLDQKVTCWLRESSEVDGVCVS
jgi:hypothetical protein